MKTKIPLITIGLDLGDMKHAICVLNQDGEIIDERTITNHRESLRRLSPKHPGARASPSRSVPTANGSSVFSRNWVPHETLNRIMHPEPVFTP